MPALRTLARNLLLQWFQFPYAILPKLGFSVRRSRFFPDKRQAELLFENRQTRTHPRPRIAVGVAGHGCYPRLRLRCRSAPERVNALPTSNTADTCMS